MNQVLIGKFIAECRKEHNLTQMQLAERLGITNRAVSKWETGKSIPDVSVMMELCEILSISVNELLCGKKLNEEEQKMESEKNTLTMVVAKKELENLQILAEVLIVMAMIVAVSLTCFVATTTLQKVITIACGCFFWAFGIWMRIKLRKAMNQIQ